MNDIRRELAVSQRIENLLVARNLRGMQSVQSSLKPGYCLRAARQLLSCTGRVLIGTGFPVLDTFESDGPAGAIALYRVLEQIGAEPILICGDVLANAIGGDYCVARVPLGRPAGLRQQVTDLLADYQPELMVSIELAGPAGDGHYYNMRGEDISSGTLCFDVFLELSDCPVIALGDGGNEIGMGNVLEKLSELAIIPSVTTCDELVIADVSNWAALGLVAMMSYCAGEDYLADWDNRAMLEYLACRGSLDGITLDNTLTEDGLPSETGKALVNSLRDLIADSGVEYPG
ncbi:glutamate cyclase domain-containing protein [uncultured Porticoccus sp.]|uniref:glutamate cyclase domain-containing protein n=1 Tax=uncultured Porticoccus sp. TaxID=1256050 RepID=UPI00260CC3CD|nr:glutamate cyclase domain-containing protein [uncultured Porticoccus sp.]